MIKSKVVGVVFTPESGNTEARTEIPDFQAMAERFFRTDTNPEAVWRSIEVAQNAVESLCRNNPEEKLISSRFTTCTTDMKAAGKMFSRFLEKVIRPAFGITEDVHFKHRHVNQLVHFHLIAACAEPVRMPRSWQVKNQHASFQAELKVIGGIMPTTPEPENDETAFLQAARERIKEVLRAGRFPIQEAFYCTPVNFGEDGKALGRYCTHYMKEAMCEGRFQRDKGARLWQASKRLRGRLPYKGVFARWANFDGTENLNKRLSRLRIAMFATEWGCRSLEELKILLGPSWAFKYRKEIYSRPMVYYFTEDQFVREWKTDLTPEQVRVFIWPQTYSRAARKYHYTFESIDPPADILKQAMIKRNSVLGMYRNRDEFIRRRNSV